MRIYRVVGAQDRPIGEASSYVGAIRIAIAAKARGEKRIWISERRVAFDV